MVTIIRKREGEEVIVLFFLLPFLLFPSPSPGEIIRMIIKRMTPAQKMISIITIIISVFGKDLSWVIIPGIKQNGFSLIPAITVLGQSSHRPGSFSPNLFLQHDLLASFSSSSSTPSSSPLPYFPFLVHPLPPPNCSEIEDLHLGEEAVVPAWSVDLGGNRDYLWKLGFILPFTHFTGIRGIFLLIVCFHLGYSSSQPPSTWLSSGDEEERASLCPRASFQGRHFWQSQL